MDDNLCYSARYCKNRKIMCDVQLFEIAFPQLLKYACIVMVLPVVSSVISTDGTPISVVFDDGTEQNLTYNSTNLGSTSAVFNIELTAEIKRKKAMATRLTSTSTGNSQANPVDGLYPNSGASYDGIFSVNKKEAIGFRRFRIPCKANNVIPKGTKFLVMGEEA